MHSIQVSLVYALKEQQWLKDFTVARGTSAGDLIEQSGLMTETEGLKGTDIQSLTLGVFAQKINVDYLLEEGDRVEVYRPLTADPKEVRRQLALLGKTMGNG